VLTAVSCIQCFAIDHCRTVFGRMAWLVDATDPLLRGFNRYAYCFTGIYGFSFFEAGEKVVELFALRGITVLVIICSL
jgi:Plasma-membrane choline transporter